nr:MAG TPA: hypothetical protein [Caudoviricetes sp.]
MRNVKHSGIIYSRMAYLQILKRKRIKSSSFFYYHNYGNS